MSTSSHAIVEGAQFPSLQAFKVAVKLWSLEAKFSHVVKDSDSFCIHVGCRGEKDCPFVINAKLKENLWVAIVTKVVDQHTYIRGVTLGHQVTNFVAWLKTNISKLVDVDSKTTTKQLKSIIRLHHGVKVPDKQLTRAQKKILAATEKAMNNNYKKIPAYLKRLVAANSLTMSGKTVVNI